MLMSKKIEGFRIWSGEAYTHLGRMLELLEREAGFLSARDAGGMLRIAEHKRQLAPLLDDLAIRRRELLGDVPGRAAMDRFLDDQGIAGAERETVRAEWERLETLVQSCRRQNEINGTYIGLLRRHVETTLDILGGPANLDATYGPDGTKRRTGRARHSYSV